MRIAAAHLRDCDVITGIGRVLDVAPRAGYETTHTYLSLTLRDVGCPTEQARDSLQALRLEGGDRPNEIFGRLDSDLAGARQRRWVAVPNDRLLEVSR